MVLSDGREALVDTTVSFVNTHQEDFLTKLNKDIPQYGNLIINKNSPYTTGDIEEQFDYSYYDRDLSGILKLNTVGPSPSVTRNKYAPIQTTTLGEYVNAGALSLSLSDASNFPPSSPLVPTINAINAPRDVVNVLSPAFVTANRIIIAITPHQITVDPGTPFPAIPPSPTTTDILYDITTPAYPGPPAAHAAGYLDNGRGHFLSHKGRIINATTFVDYTVDFTALLKPYTDGSVGTLSMGVNGNVSEPFSITINRGGNNEETIEVLWRATNTLHLVRDPKDSLNQTSLLRFDHHPGERVEVYHEATSAAGTYYPLNVAGDITGVADAASNTTDLVDPTATFVDENADAQYGDELEVIDDPTGVNTGALRTIVGFVLPTEVQVDPPFVGTLAGCTYRIRKLYKARATATAPITNQDQWLYLDNSAIFPFADSTATPPIGFSVILDRGTTQEEVVWIGENDLSLNRLRIENGDWGSPGSANPYLTKNHNFGMTVEAAQILVPSCKWEIIETRATGEFTVALEEECTPDIGINGWYLHERTPFSLLNSSLPEVAPVDGTPGVPIASLVSNISAGDTTVELTVDDFLRVFANPTLVPPYKDLQSPSLVCRAAYIKDGNGEEEMFFTTANFVGHLAVNLTTTATTMYTNIPYPVGNIRIGNYNSRYPGQVDTLMVAVPSTESTDPKYLGYWETTIPSPTYDHFAGESVIKEDLTVNVRAPITQPFAVLSAELSLITAQEHYRTIDDLSETAIRTASGGSTTSIEDATYSFSNMLVGKEVQIVDTAGVGAPLGEIRHIMAVTGPGSNTLVVFPAFSATVANTYGYIIQPTLQSGDIASNASSVVPMGDANAAFGPPVVGLNAVNHNMWAGGHRSVYPGSYLFRLRGEFEDLVDQPTLTNATVRYSPSGTDATAIYRFPGPKKLIAKPVIPYAQPAALSLVLNSIETTTGAGSTAEAITDFITAGGVIEDHTLEVLGPNTSRDWRTVHRITTWDTVSILTIDPPLKEFSSPTLEYRILGLGAALGPLHDGYFWVDYPDLFPEAGQGDFHVTIDREGGGEDVQVVMCEHALGSVNYGRFTIDPIELVTGTYSPGTTVELKVNKFTIDGGSPPKGGGFYLEFGFQQEVIRDTTVGLGPQASLARTISGVHSAVEYSTDPATPDHIEYNKYSVPDTGLQTTSDYLSSPVIRATILSGTQILGPPGTTELTLSNISFDDTLHLKYKDLIGCAVITKFSTLNPGDTLIYRVEDINPVNNVVTISPPITWGGGGAVPDLDLGGPLEIHVDGLRVDDKERFDSSPFLLKGMGVVEPLSNDFECSDASIVVTHFRVPSTVPLSKVLIGRDVIVTSGPGPAVGDRAVIVDVVENPVAGFNTIVLGPGFTGIPAPGATISVWLDEAFLPLFRDRTGGIYTPINDPNIAAPSTTNTVYPNGREYGMVEEYIDFLSSSGDIYTTATTYYFKHDHPSGTRVVIGSGVTTTEGKGHDYRPYIPGDYLALLFNSDIVDVKNLFCAAGIRCKTETTELGS